MSILIAYAHGTREASRRPTLAGLLWLANVLLALPAYLLFENALGHAVGRSAAVFDLGAFLEVLAGPSGLVRDVAGLVLLALALSLLVSGFLQGGILHALLHGQGGGAAGRDFFSGGARYYGRFLLLALGSPLLWVPAAAVFIPVHLMLKAAMGGSTNESLGSALFILRLVLALVLVSLVRMVLDYARIRIVREDSPRVLGSLAWAVRFVAGRFGRTALLYALLSLTGWAIFAAYLGLDGMLRKATGGAFVPAFLLGQLLIAGRGWLRVAFAAAQARLGSAA